MTEAEEIAQALYDKFPLLRDLKTMKDAREIVWNTNPDASAVMTDNIAEALLELCK